MKGRLCGLAAPADPVERRHEIAQAHWFGQVKHAGRSSRGRQDDHGDAREVAVRPQRVDELPPAHHGHGQVENDGPWLAVVHERERLRAVLRAAHFVPFALEHGLNRIPRPLANLQQALQLVTTSGCPNAAICIDPLNFANK